MFRDGSEIENRQGKKLKSPRPSGRKMEYHERNVYRLI